MATREEVEEAVAYLQGKGADEDEIMATLSMMGLIKIATKTQYLLQPGGELWK
jgi:hypothetical protein